MVAAREVIATVKARRGRGVPFSDDGGRCLTRHNEVEKLWGKLLQSLSRGEVACSIARFSFSADEGLLQDDTVAWYDTVASERLKYSANLLQGRDRESQRALQVGSESGKNTLSATAAPRTSDGATPKDLNSRSHRAGSSTHRDAKVG